MYFNFERISMYINKLFLPKCFMLYKGYSQLKTDELMYDLF